MSEICQQVHDLFNHLPRHRFPFDVNMIPRNGVYVLFERGEYAHGGDRIVRIGTHTGEKQLRSRLKEHFIRENKDRSIFRKNIGRALLLKANDPFLAQWEWSLTSRANRARYLPLLDVEKQQQVERAVTAYIQENFSFVVFEVDEKSDRLYWEKRIIATVSLCEACRPSPEWLGRYSPKAKIRESGLWQEQWLYKTPHTQTELNTLAQMLQID